MLYCMATLLEMSEGGCESISERGPGPVYVYEETIVSHSPTHLNSLGDLAAVLSIKRRAVESSSMFLLGS